MAKRPRAFIIEPDGQPLPVDKLKFAVFNDDGRIVSAVWTVFPAHNPAKPDIYVTASGTRALKFSFHRDILNHSVTSEAHAALVALGVVPAGSRHQLQLPIPGLPWHGLTVRLIPEVLRREGHSADDHNGTIVALPVVPDGSVLELGFFLAEGDELNIRGAAAVIGQVVSGGRALVVAVSIRQHDVAAFKDEIKDVVGRAKLPPQRAAEIDPDADLAMMMYGQDPKGFLVVTEVHNVRFSPTAGEGEEI